MKILQKDVTKVLKVDTQQLEDAENNYKNRIDEMKSDLRVSRKKEDEIMLTLSIHKKNKTNMQSQLESNYERMGYVEDTKKVLIDSLTNLNSKLQSLDS